MKQINSTMKFNEIAITHNWISILKCNAFCYRVLADFNFRHVKLVVFTARRCASEAWPCVCLSVCMCVCHKSELCRNGWTDLAGFFGAETTLRLSYTVIIEVGYFQKIRSLPSETLFRTPNLADFSVFRPRHVDRRKCCRLSSTDDRRQFITLSVRLCLQPYGRDAVRHAVHLQQLRLLNTNSCK